MKYLKRNGNQGLLMPWIILDLTDRQVSLPDLMNSHGARLNRLQFLHLSPESYSSDYKLLTDVKYEQFPHVSIVNQRKECCIFSQSKYFISSICYLEEYMTSSGKNRKPFQDNDTAISLFMAHWPPLVSIT